MLFGLLNDKKLGQLERVADGVAMIHSFANVAVVYGRGGVLLADTAAPQLTAAVITAIRAETSEPVRHIVYTHGHADHAAGQARRALHLARVVSEADRSDPEEEPSFIARSFYRAAAEEAKAAATAGRR